MDDSGFGPGQTRIHSMRLYPGARVRLNRTWTDGEDQYARDEAGLIRGWSRDNRPQVEFDSAPGIFVTIDEDALRAI